MDYATGSISLWEYNNLQERLFKAEEMEIILRKEVQELKAQIEQLLANNMKRFKDTKDYTD